MSWAQRDTLNKYLQFIFIAQLKAHKVSLLNRIDPVSVCVSIHTGEKTLVGYGCAVAWWLTPRTPDPEVGGSSPTQVTVLCP